MRNSATPAGEGDAVAMDEDGLRLRGIDDVVREAQAYFRSFVIYGRKLRVTGFARHPVCLIETELSAALPQGKTLLVPPFPCAMMAHSATVVSADRIESCLTTAATVD